MYIFYVQYLIFAKKYCYVINKNQNGHKYVDVSIFNRILHRINNICIIKKKEKKKQSSVKVLSEGKGKF